MLSETGGWPPDRDRLTVASREGPRHASALPIGQLHFVEVLPRLELLEFQEVIEGLDGSERRAAIKASPQESLLAVHRDESRELIEEFLVGYIDLLATPIARVVVRPILSSQPGLVDDTFFQHPIRHARHRSARQKHRHMAIGAVMHEGIGRISELHGCSRSLEVLMLNRECGRCVQHRPRHGRLCRNIREDRLPRRSHPCVTDEGGDCRLGTGVSPGLWNTHTNRRAIRIALEAYGATHGSHRQVRGRAIGHWTVAPER